MDENEQSLKQKKIAFAQSGHIEAVIAIIRECSGVSTLLGKTEYETVINAATLDAQQELLRKFINTVDFIKKGGLHQPHE